jgi:peroxiredoxin
MTAEAETPKIKPGDRIPGNIYFGVLKNGEEEPRKVEGREIFDGKKVVLFGIPGKQRKPEEDIFR